MTEAYLHFIWKLKRLPFHQLKTTEGKEILVLNNGIHNMSESGPDFFNARMIYEHMEWAGQIEMHIKSSDWYRHRHHTDAAYNNVILHVVYEHDREIILNGAALPTIELKDLIDTDHYAQWERFANAMKDIPCEDSIQQIDTVFLKTMIHRAVIDRLDRKTRQLLYLYDELDQPSALYNLLARAFGTKVNSGPFELLTNHVPLATLKRQNRATQKRLLLQASGLYTITEPGNPVTVQEIPAALWKRKGLRPPAFPEKRVLQFSEFIARCNFGLLAEYLSPEEAHDYILFLAEELNKKNTNFISAQLLDQLFINALLPYYWIKSIRTEDESLKEFVLSFMEKLKPEENYILRKWEKIGIRATNAYESQALTELYNEHCTRKKCFTCQVGMKILNSDA